MIDDVVHGEEKEIRKRQEPWLGRFAITMIAAFVVALPALIFTWDLSYYAYPPTNYEHGSGVGLVLSGFLHFLVLAYLYAVIALLVSYQTGSFAKTISPLRRVLSAVGAVCGPPVVVGGIPFIIAIGMAFTDHGAMKGRVGGMIRFAVWTVIWLLPWFVYIYLFRLLMSLVSHRWAAIVLYVTGVVLMAGMVYPLSLWMGNSDGEGQGMLALTAAMALSVLISTGLADLALWGSQNNDKTEGEEKCQKLA